MIKPHSRYPFDQFTEVGKTLTKAYEPGVNLYLETMRIRTASINWARSNKLPWRFKIELLTADHSIRITRKQDDGPTVGSPKVYVPTERDKRGDGHRKYDFASLDRVGKHLIKPMNEPEAKRVSAHIAGMKWAKDRDLDWRFRVMVTADRMHLRIERIK